jgi:hypothetical protein
MTRYTKNSSGHYLIHGHKYEMLEGSRAQVLHGTAYKTSGGLKKHELLQNKNGRIVSRKKHLTAKKEKRLVRAGFGTKKGKFGYVKIGKSKKMRGGYKGAPLAPMDLGDSVGTNAYQSTGGSRRRRRGGKFMQGGTGATGAMGPQGVQGVQGVQGQAAAPTAMGGKK